MSRFNHIDAKITELPLIQVEEIEEIIITAPDWYIETDNETLKALELAENIQFLKYQAY